MSQLTFARNGSRWAEVSWERPQDPKGQMTGYVLVALMMPSQKCVSAVKWVCSDCNISVLAEQVQHSAIQQHSTTQRSATLLIFLR